MSKYTENQYLGCNLVRLPAAENSARKTPSAADRQPNSPRDLPMQYLRQGRRLPCEFFGVYINYVFDIIKNPFGMISRETSARDPACACEIGNFSQ
jgi:hypothetical protein